MMNVKSIRALCVADVMTQNVMTIESDTPIGKALAIMEREHVSALPIIDDHHCVGIVTAIDLVKLIRQTNEAIRSGYPHYEDCLWAIELVHHRLDEQPVREIMNVVVDTIRPEMPLSDAAQRLSCCARHHLIVADEDGVVGCLSSWDIARAFC